MSAIVKQLMKEIYMTPEIKSNFELFLKRIALKKIEIHTWVENMKGIRFFSITRAECALCTFVAEKCCIFYRFL